MPEVTPKNNLESSPPTPESLRWPPPPPPPEETFPPGEVPPPEIPPEPSPSSFFARPLWQKILPLVIGLFVLLFLFFLFFRFFKSPAEKENLVTLTYWGLWEEEQVIAPLVADFEKNHPQTKINYQKQSPRQYRERLQSALARGEGPDIFRFHNTWLPMFKNDLAPLPKKVMDEETFKKTFYPVAQKDLRWGDSYYGLPLEFDGLALLYNEKFFQEKGLLPPTGWENLGEIAQKLTVWEKGRIQVGGIALGTTNNVEHWSDILALMFLQNGANLKNPTDQRAQDALTYYVSFAQGENRVWDETLPNSLLAFAQGKVAMIFAPSWEIFEIKNLNPNFSFKVLSVPQLPGGNLTWASFWVEGVAQKSKNQSQAWEFLKYLSTKESLVKLYTEAAKIRLFGEPYSRQDLAEALLNDPFVWPYLAGAANAQSFYLASRTFDNGLNDKIIKYFEDAVNALHQGISPQAALETAAKGVNQTLSTYGLTPP